MMTKTRDVTEGGKQHIIYENIAEYVKGIFFFSMIQFPSIIFLFPICQVIPYFMLGCNPFPVLYIADAHASQRQHNMSFPWLFKNSTKLEHTHLFFLPPLSFWCTTLSLVYHRMSLVFVEFSAYQFIIKTDKTTFFFSS